MSVLSGLLDNYSDDVARIAANKIDDYAKASLSDLFSAAGKATSDRTASGVRNNMIDILSDSAVDEGIRREILERTPIAARVWNDPSAIEKLSSRPTFRSQAFQYGNDLDHIIWQYSDESGAKSAVTLSDLDDAFSRDLFTGIGDLFTPYADEGSGAFYRWARENGISPSTREEIMQKYFNPLVENIDNPGWRPSSIMGYDDVTRPTGARYDEFVSPMAESSILPKTRHELIPDIDGYWDIDEAEIAANEYKDKLLKEFSGKGGRDMLNKAIPAVSIIGGGSILGALLGGGDNTQNRA